MADLPASVMIFAAGFGTRMGALTKSCPKPLLKVAGRTMLDRAIDMVRPLELPIFVNAHYHADQIKDHLAGHRNITILHEDPAILDTGGGLKNALSHMPQGPVLTLNPDALWTGLDPIKPLLSAWENCPGEALLTLISRNAARGYIGPGNFKLDSANRLSRSQSGLLYGGLQIIWPDRVSRYPGTAFSMRAIWFDMIDAGTLHGHHHEGNWIDIGTSDALEKAERMPGV